MLWLLLLLLVKVEKFAPCSLELTTNSPPKVNEFANEASDFDNSGEPRDESSLVSELSKTDSRIRVFQLFSNAIDKDYLSNQLDSGVGRVIVDLYSLNW